MANVTHSIEALVNKHCQCGENPLWHEDEKKLYWVDIPNGLIYRYDPQSGEHETVYDGDVVGGFTFQTNGQLLLFRDNNIALLENDGNTRVITRNIPGDTGRFNDVLADPQGRVFAGTMGKDGKNNGGLFRVDLDGSVTQLWDGTGCANGMGFSPDLKQFYWTDSSAGKIFIFDYQQETGELTNRRTFYSSPEKGVIPDGLSVDSLGYVWSAQWNGFGVRKLSANGEILEEIKLPVGAVTSCIFAGDNLDELYITTAEGQARKGQKVKLSTADGTLYRARPGVQGQKNFRSNIQVG